VNIHDLELDLELDLEYDLELFKKEENAGEM